MDDKRRQEIIEEFFLDRKSEEYRAQARERMAARPKPSLWERVKNAFMAVAMWLACFFVVWMLGYVRGMPPPWAVGWNKATFGLIDW